MQNSLLKLLSKGYNNEMAKSIKTKLVSIPVFGKVMLVMKKLSNLPERQEFEDKKIANLEESTNKLIDKLENSEIKYSRQILKLDNLQKQINSLDKAMSFKLNQNVERLKSVKGADLISEDHILDNFYTSFEDKFRGNEDEIKQRQSQYLNFFKNSKIDFEEYPVVDLGSGRGEFLEILKQNEINALGIDLNSDMVDRVKKKKLNVVQYDALKYVEETKPQSIGAITGFHIIEHIPFNSLLRLFSNAHSALVDDGFVIFETPNPENIVVGSNTFYLDPSHLNPLPPDLIKFALETSNFSKTEVLRIHPAPIDESDKKLSSDIVNRFYGPRDYAVIGYK